MRAFLYVTFLRCSLLTHYHPRIDHRGKALAYLERLCARRKTSPVHGRARNRLCDMVWF